MVWISVGVLEFCNVEDGNVRLPCFPEKSFALMIDTPMGSPRAGKVPEEHCSHFHCR